MIHDEASDPKTPAARLRELSLGKSPEASRRVASNPAAPPDLLLALAPRFPDEVAANATLPLHLFDHPALLDDLVLLRCLPRCRRLPAWLLDLLAARWTEHPPSALAAALGELLVHLPSTPAAVIASLCTCRIPHIRTRAAQRLDAPRTLIERLTAAGSEPTLARFADPRPSIEPDALRRVARLGPWGAQLAASHPAAPPALLSALATDRRPCVLAALAANPSAPAPLLEQLSQHPSHRVQLGLARNPSLPQAALRHLAQSPDNPVLHALIDHPASTPELLRTLARHEGLREHLASAPATPPELLADLGHDESPSVRRLAAANPRTPPTIVELLALDPLREIRAAAVANPRLGAAAVQRLTRDRASDVRARALMRLRRPDTR